METLCLKKKKNNFAKPFKKNLPLKGAEQTFPLFLHNFFH